MKLKYGFIPLVILFTLLVSTPFVAMAAPGADGDVPEVITDTVAVEPAEALEPLSGAPVTPTPVFDIPFLETMTPGKLLTLFIGSLIGLSQGLFPGKSIFTVIKDRLGLDDFKAQAMVIMLTAALSALSLFLLGYFRVGEVGFTWEMFFGLSYLVYTMSQGGYSWFKGTLKPDINAEIVAGLK